MKLAKLNSFILPISMPDICIAINVECSQKWLANQLFGFCVQQSLRPPFHHGHYLKIHNKIILISTCSFDQLMPDRCSTVAKSNSFSKLIRFWADEYHCANQMKAKKIEFDVFVCANSDKHREWEERVAKNGCKIVFYLFAILTRFYPYGRINVMWGEKGK